MKKRALLIGNNNYNKFSNLFNLKSCENDVDALGNILETVGFKVEKHKNLNSDRTVMEIDSFYKESANEEINLFYFSGHGGNNGEDDIILPVDFSEENYILVSNIINSSKNINSYNIFIFDCCRNTILNNEKKASTLTVEPEYEVFIAKATNIGREAYPGGKKSLSVFTTFLVKYLSLPNLSLDEIFNNVKYEIKRSKSSQLPQITTTMTRSIILNKSINEKKFLDNEIKSFLKTQPTNDLPFSYIMASNYFKIPYLDMMYFLDDNMYTSLFRTNLMTEHDIKLHWHRYLKSQRGYTNIDGRHLYKDTEFQLGELPELIKIQPEKAVEPVFRNIKLTIDAEYNLIFQCNVLNLDENFKMFLSFVNQVGHHIALPTTIVVGRGNINYSSNIKYIDLKQYKTLELRSVVMTAQDLLTADIKNKYGENGRNLWGKNTDDSFGLKEERLVFKDLSEFIQYI